MLPFAPVFGCIDDIYQIARSRYSFRNAIRFAKILKVDTAMAAEWQGALDAMPEYPLRDINLPFVDPESGVH